MKPLVTGAVLFSVHPSATGQAAAGEFVDNFIRKRYKCVGMG